MVNYRRVRRQFLVAQQRAADRAASAAKALLQRDHYTGLCVLRSAAGWHVGSLFWDAEGQYYCPGSRDSGYFSSREAASCFLTAVS